MELSYSYRSHHGHDKTVRQYKTFQEDMKLLNMDLAVPRDCLRFQAHYFNIIFPARQLEHLPGHSIEMKRIGNNDSNRLWR